MVSVETATSATVVQAKTRSVELPMSSPRISFSADFLDDDKDFISISPNTHIPKKFERQKDRIRSMDFEFLSNVDSPAESMTTADELFFEGKLLPFWQMQHSEKLNKISLKPKDDKEEQEKEVIKEESSTNRINWFIDEDPSPRPPKCTLLWKELLRMKKQRAASTLSPSSSSSSTSSSSSSSNHVDVGSMEDGKGSSKGGLWNREKHVKRIKKGLERTRSASIRIKPVLINMPICSQGGSRTSALPPLFPLRKMNVDR